MRHEELTQQGLGDAANYFRGSDMKNGTAILNVLAVVNHQIDPIAATPSPTTIWEHMQPLQIVSGQSQMPAVTLRPGSN